MSSIRNRGREEDVDEPVRGVGPFVKGVEESEGGFCAGLYERDCRGASEGERNSKQGA